jgi:hypothetical protein
MLSSGVRQETRRFLRSSALHLLEPLRQPVTSKAGAEVVRKAKGCPSLPDVPNSRPFANISSSLELEASSSCSMQDKDIDADCSTVSNAGLR